VGACDDVRIVSRLLIRFPAPTEVITSPHDVTCRSSESGYVRCRDGLTVRRADGRTYVTARVIAALFQSCSVPSCPAGGRGWGTSSVCRTRTQFLERSFSHRIQLGGLGFAVPCASSRTSFELGAFSAAMGSNLHRSPRSHPMLHFPSILPGTALCHGPTVTCRSQVPRTRWHFSPSSARPAVSLGRLSVAIPLYYTW